MVQWLRLCTSTAGVMGLIPGQGTKIPDATHRVAKLKKRERKRRKGREEERKEIKKETGIHLSTGDLVSVSWCYSLSHVQLFVTPWSVACQAPLSMGLSRQEYWSRLPFPSPGDLPNPGIEPRSPALQVDSLPSEPPGKPSGELGVVEKNPN